MPPPRPVPPRPAMRAPLLLAALAALAACDAGDPGSLYDPDATGNPAPVVSSVSPGGVVLAGIDEVTIAGQNFSPVPAENTVLFEDGAGGVAQGTVLAASPTELRVRVPNTPGETVRVRVAVRGARDFSNAVATPLTAAVVPFGDLDTGIQEDPRGITSGPDGTLYVTLFRLGRPVGIKRFTADGVRSDYSSQDALWSGLTLTPDGTALVGARQIRALFLLPEGDGRETFAVVPQGAGLGALTTTPGGDVWAGGTNSSDAGGSLYRVSPDGTTAAFPFAPPVRGLASTAEALYAAASSTSGGQVTASAVYRFPFAADGSIGEGEVIYDVTASLGVGVGATSVAVAQDGTVFVGTTAADPVIQVTPDGAAAPLYPGVLPSPITALAWGLGSKLYAIQGTADLQTDPVGDLFVIETRRPGPFSGSS